MRPSPTQNARPAPRTGLDYTETNANDIHRPVERTRCPAIPEPPVRRRCRPNDTESPRPTVRAFPEHTLHDDPPRRRSQAISQSRVLDIRSTRLHPVHRKNAPVYHVRATREAGARSRPAGPTRRLVWRKGVRSQKPGRPDGCFAFLTPDPFSPKFSGCRFLWCAPSRLQDTAETPAPC